MDFRVLGVLEVVHEGRSVDLGRPKQRALLARLLLQPNQVVSVDRLAEDLWEGDPPAEPSTLLQPHISRLRRALAEAAGGRDVLISRRPGYVLCIERHELDAWCFEEAMGKARAALAAGRPTAAHEELVSALGLWRGSPLADVSFAAFARAEIARLEELRGGAVEMLVEARLALGHHHELLGQLDAMVSEFPLRERLWAHKMVALYRCGRQADALRAYQELRRVLGDELGIDPSPTLQDLELAMLRQDPGLAWEPPVHMESQDDGPAPPPLAVDRRVAGSQHRLVGREAERHRLREQLGVGRLVTLVGPPGSGKSCLAAEAAAELTPAPTGGVWRVDLGPVAKDALVARAVADVIAPDDAAAAIDAVAGAIDQRAVLLVLDNCGHVREGCAALARALLTRCPGLRILATSREPLGVEGELITTVPPLSLPPPGGAASFDEVSESEAVRLFVERASAVVPGFELTPSNAGAVAEVCRHLDGIPLAIELAASRAAALSPAAMAEELAGRGASATDDDAAALRGALVPALQWSYELLSPAERALLRRLTVFSGSASFEAVEAVCAGGDLPACDVVDCLTRLVSKSLVVAEHVGNETRYRLLQTIARFGRDRLAEAHETAEFRSRHAGWCVSLAEQVEPELTGPSQRLWLERLDLEQPNIRCALEWSLADRRPEIGLRLGASLVTFWRVRGHVSEGRKCLDQALAGAASAPAALRARACWAAASLAVAADGCAAAVPLLEQAVALGREAGETATVTRSLLLLGQCFMLTRGPSEAEPVLQECMAMARAAGDTWCLAQALVTSGDAHEQRGDFSAARPLFEECVAAARGSGDDQSLALGLLRLGVVALKQADYAVAEPLLEEALVVNQELGNRSGEVEALTFLGRVAVGKGAYDRADDLLGRAMDLARQLGSPARALAAPLHALGVLAQAEGDAATARARFTEALDALQEARMSDLPALLGLAEVAQSEGNLVEAGALLEEALPLALAHVTTDTNAVATALHDLARLARSEGDMERAVAYEHEALKMWADSGHRLGVTMCIEGLAGLAADAGRGRRAAQLLAAAQAIRAAHGLARPPSSEDEHERDLAAVRALLEPDDFAAAWTIGEAMSWEEVLACAADGAEATAEEHRPRRRKKAAPAGVARVLRPYRALAVASPESQARARWGERLAVVGDVDGDGVADLIVAVPGFDVGRRRDVGRVYALSGAALAEGRAEVLYVIDAPNPETGGKFGFALRPLGDVDGDGITDFAIGSYIQDEVWVFSGATGSLVSSLANPLQGEGPRGSSGFGSRLANVGDLDGDGVCEVMVGAPNAGDGAAFVFHGVTGELLQTLHLPAEDAAAQRAEGCGAGFGMAVHGPGDIDGDGVPDLLVSAPTFDRRKGRMYLYSGRTGELVSKIDSPEPQSGALFGFQDVAPFAPGDVNGDGRAEIYANAFHQAGTTGAGEGQAWVLDPCNGDVLYTLKAPAPEVGAQFGWSMTAGVGPDGQTELYVGAAPHDLPGASQSGGTYAFAATDGSLLAALELPAEHVQHSTPTNWGPNLGWAVAAAGDLDGDGLPDYVASSPFTDVGDHQDAGLLFVFLSSLGRT